MSKLVVLPNVWTEADNLLNREAKGFKYEYIIEVKGLLNVSTETYVPTERAIDDFHFYNLGLTDTLLLQQAQYCELLITSDSKLSDFAAASGIPVFDLVRFKNERL